MNDLIIAQNNQSNINFEGIAGPSLPQISVRTFNSSTSVSSETNISTQVSTSNSFEISLSFSANSIQPSKSSSSLNAESTSENLSTASTASTTTSSSSSAATIQDDLTMKIIPFLTIPIAILFLYLAYRTYKQSKSKTFPE